MVTEGILKERIKKLKKERNAVILAHNYQKPEIQDIADYVGDSLGLSIKAAQTKAKVIIFCGVYFMAETAKILSPDKKILLPEKEAGCPMADMITASQLREMKQQHPGAKVLCYVNTSAEVKAEAYICCTSANAIKMAKEAFDDEEEIIFVPDKYLGDYVARQTAKKLILWEGYCPVHIKIGREDIERQKQLYPKALVLAHPECKPEVLTLADAILSTEGMCKFVQSSPKKEFILATEKGILYRLKKERPEKSFYPANESAICEDMKKIDLRKVLRSLEELVYEVVLPSRVIFSARKSIEKMLKQA